ncbi:MAG: DUF4184 family protein [Flavipsychrobacter sp.]|nr:DUF4184 family protein [Flavipsychrobacter sp.]
MPFTFSHPAAILPFLNKNRNYISATGLIIGSMAPDFESFIFLNEKKIYGHTWPGIFWFDLPLAILLAIVYHVIVRDALIKNLPWALYERLQCFEGINWMNYFKKHFFVVIISMLIGIFSHLLLDAFTHLNLVDPDATDSPIYLGHVQVYLLLQYTLSVVGLILAAYYVLKIPAVQVQKTEHNRMTFKISSVKHSRATKVTYWVLVMIFTCLTMIIAIYFMEREMNIILFIDISITGVCSAFIIVPLVQKLIIPANY